MHRLVLWVCAFSAFGCSAHEAHDAGSGDASSDASRPADAGQDANQDAEPPERVGRYLDRCESEADCESGSCVEDVGGSRMCTIACTAHGDCASEHLCADGTCVRSDTGAPCSTADPTACALELCIGNASTGAGHCTRECEDASDCPAGFACGDAGGVRVCVGIERGCGGASECVTGLCLPVQGCTAECRTPADCPRRFGSLPPYECEVAFGSTNPICVPPEDILGADPAGTTCRFYEGQNLCRSQTCDDAAPDGPMCTQACTEAGGCGPGLGCGPAADGTATLQCTRAGAQPLGASCASGQECDSGLCDEAGFCTRSCTDDALCPTGMRCDPVPEYGISICRR